MIQEKVKSLHDNLKQKEGEGYKTGEFNANKRWFNNFSKRIGFKHVKITGEAASADQGAAEEVLDAVKKITGEKGYLPEQVCNADESALFWKKVPQRALTSKEEVNSRI